MGPGGKEEGEDTRGKRRFCVYLLFLNLNEGGLVWQPLKHRVWEMWQETDASMGRDNTGEIITVIVIIYLTDGETEAQKG